MELGHVTKWTIGDKLDDVFLSLGEYASFNLDNNQFFLLEFYRQITTGEIHNFKKMPLHLACRFDAPVLTLLWGHENGRGAIAWSETSFNILRCHPDSRNINYKPGLHLTVQALLGDLDKEEISALRFFTMSTAMSEYVAEAIDEQINLGEQMDRMQFERDFQAKVNELYRMYPDTSSMAASCPINEIAGINA